MDKLKKHAFLIGCYKYPDYLNELVDSLNSSRSNFYIHVNKDNYDEFENIIKLKQSSNNINFVSSIRVKWGGFSFLKSIKIMLEEAIKDDENEFFHLISGQDALCCPINMFFNFFDNNSSSNFIQPSTPINSDDKRMAWFKYYHFYDYINMRSKVGAVLDKLFELVQKVLGINRPLPYNNVYKAGGWFSLNRKGALALLDVMRSPDFKKWEYTFAAEELFVHTVLNNCKENLNLVYNDHRYIIWGKKEHERPFTLDETFYNDIVASDAFFCRKIDPVISRKLLDKFKKL